MTPSLPETLRLTWCGRQMVILSMASGADRAPGPDRPQLRRRAGGRLLTAAQRELGLPVLPVERDRFGGPLWPRGQRGSFSHWNGTSLCLLSPDDDFDWGVDLEGHAGADALAAICGEAVSSAERALLRGDLPRQAALVFSAKESVYKAARPQVGHLFGFDALRLLAEPGTGTLRFELTRDLSPGLAAGRAVAVGYRHFAGSVLTWTALHSPAAISAES
ncbi:4'-phosphopantetheinyl transferase family protein [Celeribacter indicus]|nr:4'-phosphopantetheinyl transferase superfamily protein [Celeribacter indicus]